MEGRKRHNGWHTAAVIITALLLAALLALEILRYSPDILRRLAPEKDAVSELSGDTAAVFENPLIEKAAREYTGIESGDITVSGLAGLRSLYIVGDRYFFYEPETGISMEEMRDTSFILDPDGNKIAVRRGSIRGLSDFKYFSGLTTLWLQFQDLGSMQTMPVCAIESLDISGDRVTSLGGICNLPRLAVLVTDGCPLTDLNTLGQCRELRSISLLGARASDFSAIGRLKSLDSAAVSYASLGQLRPVLRQRGLSSLTLEGCDLSGDFFSSISNKDGLSSMSLKKCFVTSLDGAQRLSSLKELTIKFCAGVSDWSQLRELPALASLNTDGTVEKAPGGAAASTPFKISVG